RLLLASEGSFNYYSGPAVGLDSQFQTHAYRLMMWTFEAGLIRRRAQMVSYYKFLTTYMQVVRSGRYVWKEEAESFALHKMTFFFSLGALGLGTSALAFLAEIALGSPRAQKSETISDDEATRNGPPRKPSRIRPTDLRPGSQVEATRLTDPCRLESISDF